MFQATVGIDIAKKKFDVVLLIENNYRHKDFSNIEAGFQTFIAWLLSFNLLAPPLICLEATGAYSLHLTDLLVAKVYSNSLINPVKINAFAKSELGRTQTHKADAKLIVRYAMTMQPDSMALIKITLEVPALVTSVSIL